MILNTPRGNPPYEESLWQFTKKGFIISLFVMVLSVPALASDWKYFRTDAENGLCYYDAQNVSRNQDVVKVWEKNVLSGKTKKEYIKKFPNTPGIKKMLLFIKGRF